MLHVHRAERTSELARGLAALLEKRSADALAPEVVAVPTKGVERWLAQRLSHHLGAAAQAADGVCANVSFPSPARLLAEAFTAGGGVDPDDDPWAVGRTTWTLVDIIDTSLVQPWCAPLAGHLGTATEHAPGRRLTTSQRLARLFQSYAVARPGMLREWVAGEDTDGAGNALPTDLTWQAELWRRLRMTLGADSPAERLPAACQALQDTPDLVDLPERVSLFGPTRLTTAQLEILTALGAHRDVHLWLPHPSPALWATLERCDAASPRRRDDTSADETENPLVASLGRDVRELQLRLRSYDHSDEHLPARDAEDTDSLLARLQDSIRDDTNVPLARPATEDRSVQVHACHGPARQVEVLREVLVGLLADDPTLEPRDVLVMCPNIEDYAPLISATFGLVDDHVPADAHPGHRLRVRLADRSLRQTNPMLGLLASLLDLAGGRVTASHVLDLAALAPVRKRFSFDDDDLELLQTWVGDAGVRWGLDAEHRRRFELQGVAQNTWRAGLDRILLGAAMAEDGLRWIGTALPLDDVDSNDIDLAGRLAELMSRLTDVLDRLDTTAPLAHWLATLTDALELLGETSESDAWQRAQADRELAELTADAAGRADTTQLTLGDVQVLLADRLAGRPTRANFRTGNLTMCSMVPMRSVPHRVICLLGLDDGAFPRGAGTDGDDVLARDPCLGERDPRSEDRQLLLDAVMAAREHLVILYTGADPRTNVEQPPAVPVGEILDVVGRDGVVVRHPLQPFDPRNFRAGELAVDRPFSFDRTARAGAVAAVGPRVEPTPFLTSALAPVDSSEILLDDLIRFYEHPAKALLRQRLGVTLLSDEQEAADEIAVELSGLARYAAGERVLQACVAGTDFRAACGAEWRRGTLPPANLGLRAIDDMKPLIEATVNGCCDLLAHESRTVDVVVDVSGARLTGTVPGVRGTTVLRTTFASLAPKHRIRAWVQQLTLTSAIPAEEWRTVTVGLDRPRVRRASTGPLDPAAAGRWLADLVELYRDGLCRPLPMAPKTSADYARRRIGGADEMLARNDAERTCWAQRDYPERDDAYDAVWGPDAPLSVLCADPAETDGTESTRFGEVALRVWEPLLAAESVVAL